MQRGRQRARGARRLRPAARRRLPGDLRSHRRLRTKPADRRGRGRRSRPPGRCPQGQGLHPFARPHRQNRRHRRPGPRPLRPGAPRANWPLGNRAADALEELRTLVRLRRQLVDYRTALTNQLKAPGGEVAKERLQSLVDTTSEHIAGIEADLNTLIDRIPTIAEARRNHQPNPRLRTADRDQRRRPDAQRSAQPPSDAVASLAGLAPHPYDSGERHGYRRTRGGRPEVKRVLFMAAMAARNHNPDLKAFYTPPRRQRQKTPRRHHRRHAQTHHHHQRPNPRCRQGRRTPTRTELMTPF